MISVARARACVHRLITDDIAFNALEMLASNNFKYLYNDNWKCFEIIIKLYMNI